MKNILLISLLILTVFDVKAQWHPDTAINTPICNAVFKQKELKMKSDGKGGAFMVWKDYRQGNWAPSIYVQRVDSNGLPQWTFDGAGACTLNSDQSTPSIVSDGKDGIIVAWSDWRSGVERDIYAQRIDPNGNMMWTTNGNPVTIKPAREHSQKMISDGESGTIVVWEQQRPNFTWDIWTQRLDSNGNEVWASGGLPICIEGSNRRNHKIQKDGKGGAIYTWQDLRSGNYDMYAQRIDANGNLLWGNTGIPVCIAADSQTNGKIDPAKDVGGVFISWIDKRNGVDYDIYAQKVDSNGNVLWGTTGMPVVTAAENQSAVDILSNNKTKGVIITWKDKRAGEYDIYVQKLDLNGNPVWPLNGVEVSTSAGSQKNPNIISDKRGGAIITWQDKRFAEWDIFAQRIDSAGLPKWKINGQAIGLAADDQTGPKNAPDNKGGSIFGWEDKRNLSSKDIYIHHFIKVDTVPTIDTVIPIDSSDLLDTVIIDTFYSNYNSVYSFETSSINKVYPNPFTEFVSIQFIISEKTEFKFQLIDVLGKVIHTEITPYALPIGNSVIRINTSEFNLSSGIYYLKVSDSKNSNIIPLNKK